MSQTAAQIGAHEGGASGTREMRAGVYRGKGQIVVESVPVPQIGEGEVLFRVAACGICGTDIKKIHHGFVKPPQILGHELAGTVVEVGRGVRKFKAGDRVVSFHHVPCGTCFYCERRLYSQCAGYKKVGLTAGFDPNGGGFGQYVRAMPWVVEGGMLPVPAGATFEDATFVEPVNTCLKAVRKARVARREKVLVIGQGPIGMLLMLLAKYEGAEVFTSDPMPGRREASERFGASKSFDPARANLANEIRAQTDGRGADAVLLAVPNPSLVAEALALTRPGGRVLLFAHNDPVMKLEFPAAAVGIEEKEILGSYSASIDEQEESAKLVFNHNLPVRELISHRFPLERIADAIELAAHPADNTLKVVIIHE
ncbi:MAG TPA: alcohol dehydrogenase catalytic domain-containing protein [Candidatus Acidoferrum sp.]|nr:alcohol dehydrogenase catalytic domain-containing protein [Candidatus Acidoferrum sp.]